MDLVIPGVQSVDGNSNNANFVGPIGSFYPDSTLFDSCYYKKSKRVQKCKFKLINNSAHLFKVDSK